MAYQNKGQVAAIEKLSELLIYRGLGVSRNS